MDDSTDAAPTRAALRFGGVTPILRVEKLDVSLAFYTERLGFAEEWRDGGFASVARGRATLMLCEGDQGHAGTWVYVGVSDADALHEELRARGVAIRHPPANYPWGAREMQVTDPDGHVLRFGSDALPGEPLGEWLDGNRRRQHGEGLGDPALGEEQAGSCDPRGHEPGEGPVGAVQGRCGLVEPTRVDQEKAELGGDVGLVFGRTRAGHSRLLHGDNGAGDVTAQLACIRHPG